MDIQDAAPAGAVPTGTEPIDPALPTDTFEQIGRQVAGMLRETHEEVAEQSRLEARAEAASLLAEAEARLREVDARLAEAERRLADASVQAAARLAEADRLADERIASIRAREESAVEVFELAVTLVEKLDGRLVRISAEGRAATHDLAPLRKALLGVGDGGSPMEAANGQVIDLREMTAAAPAEA
jgi:hypothetical protein